MAVVEYFGMLDTPMPDQRLGLFELDPLVMEPVSAIKYLSNISKLDSFRCPAFTDYLKNVYYICSPLDFTITRNNNIVTITNDRNRNIDLSMLLFNKYPDQKDLNGISMVTIPLQYFFINKDSDISIQVIDPPLTPNLLTNVCGEFNISKWVRPTNFSFFMHPECETITFKRGEPLYAVRFNTAEPIKLLEITDEDRRKLILTEQQKAVAMKKWYPGLSLTKAYEIFNRRMKSLWK